MGYMGYVPVHVEIEVELENKECKVMSLLEEQEIDQFRIIDVRESSKGKIGHMVNIPQTQLDLIAGKIPFDIVHTGKARARRYNHINSALRQGCTLWVLRKTRPCRKQANSS